MCIGSGMSVLTLNRHASHEYYSHAQTLGVGLGPDIFYNFCHGPGMFHGTLHDLGSVGVHISRGCILF